MPNDKQFIEAMESFDAYNSNDPNKENVNGVMMPKELVYAQRMTKRLTEYSPNAAEHVQLAVRCQHIGRWEIPRDHYPMDRKGYLKWRTVLKSLHASIATKILKASGYEDETIEKVKSLVLKKALYQNTETQLLEDVVCLVFIEYYLNEFSTKHTGEKLIEILRKTMKKMSPKAIEAVSNLSLSEKIKLLIHHAVT